MSMDDLPRHEPDGTAELVSDEQAIAVVRGLIAERNFTAHNTTSNAMFALNLAHWAAEVFGQRSRSEYIVYPDRNFESDELPAGLEQLVTMHPFGFTRSIDNGVWLETSPQTLEVDPTIPKWDELQGLAFADMTQAALNDPDILHGIVPGSLDVVPGVTLTFNPRNGWGLQFIIEPTGVRVIPFGQQGKTTAAFNYAVGQQGRHIEMAETACGLVLLAAQYTTRRSRPDIPAAMVQALHARLAGEATIPVDYVRAQPSPRNAEKALLVAYLKEVGAIGAPPS